MNTEVRGSGSGLILEVKDRTFKAGERVEVSFTSPNFKGISGFQGTMSIGNKQLAIDKIEPGSLHVSDHNFGRRWENEGLITMSWNTNRSIDLEDKDVLFTLVFTAQSSGSLSEVLRVSSQKTLAESYEGKGELGNLSIRFVSQNGQEITTKSALYQNYPNPFDNRTVIGINLAEQCRGTFKVTDITGRTIKKIEKEWAKGYNEVWIDRREMKASGVLYYSFEGGSFRATKKMIIME
ncbi:MAG: T9SS type A sorting domain-containing protein [Saprospiraceae bacterium]|nr:T9SS type A sorting domain-containing protein [Saprospiraceae bacterium]